MALDLDQGGRAPQVHRVWLGPSLGWIYADEPLDVEMVISGGQVPITPGMKGYLIIPEWVTVMGWVVLANQIGSIQIDVWKIPLTTFIAGTAPTAADSITGSDIPRLVGQIADRSTDLSGWTTFIEQNDVLAFNINSCSAITKVTITIQSIRNKGAGA